MSNLCFQRNSKDDLLKEDRKFLNTIFTEFSKAKTGIEM